MTIRKGNKHQLGLFFLLEACQRNAAGWSTAVWPANAKLPLPHRRSSITRPCCSIERSSAKLLVFTCTSKFERSTGSESERVYALGLRVVEVIIFMITSDFSVISITSQASLSLPLTKVTEAQYRKRFRASYNNSIWRSTMHSGIVCVCVKWRNDSRTQNSRLKITRT